MYDDDDNDERIDMSDVDLLLARLDDIDESMENFRYRFSYRISRINKHLESIEEGRVSMEDITSKFALNAEENDKIFKGISRIHSRFEENLRYVDNAKDIGYRLSGISVNLKSDIEKTLLEALTIFKKVSGYMNRQEFVVKRLQKDNEMLTKELSVLKKNIPKTNKLVRDKYATELMRKLTGVENFQVKSKKAIEG